MLKKQYFNTVLHLLTNLSVQLYRHSALRLTEF